MTEQELEQTAARLGADQAKAVDPDRIARQVLARLAAEPAVVPPIRPPIVRWLVGLAAAAALALVVRAITPSSLSSPSSLSVLHELDDLGTSELEAILESIPATAEAIPPFPETDPRNDLDSTSLARLLRSLEG